MSARLKKFPWFLAAVLLICLWPVYGLRARNYRPLIGVTVQTQRPAASVESVMDGSWQDGFNTWWQENIPGRSFLIRLRNEFVYTVLRTSPNHTLTIGRKGGLHARLHIDYYFNNGGRYISPQQLTEGVQKLQRFDELLAAHGKTLYVFLTPLKTRFTEDDLPWYVDAGMHKTDEYTQFLSELKKTDLKFFDGIAFLQENQGLLPAEYFYPTALHWDPCWSAAATIGLLDRMRQTGPWDLGIMTMETEKTTHVVVPNADLEDLLNRMALPSFENYQPVITTVPGADRPSLFVRTSSFGFTSLRLLTDSDLFGPTVYFENQTFISRDAAGSATTQTVTAYDQIDLGAYLRQSDIVVLELLELQYGDPGFGMIDYILENPQMLDQH